MHEYDEIWKLVEECILTHNEIVLVELIVSLQNEYVDLSNLSTFGEYESNWTHQDVLNYVTFNT
tara:strand:+ start:1925 stop:2116 length:192 start_codon:yes stop_codon:yes gene_type:complete